MEEAYNALGAGGWLMLPILLASIIGLALFLDRLLYLRVDRMVPPAFLSAARDEIGRRDAVGLRSLCGRYPSAVARMLARGLTHAGGDRLHMRESMEDAGRLELQLMRRNLGAMAAVATVAPLLGLLGTVVGMITTFQAIVASAGAGAGFVDISELAGGIWQALLTTAAGLTVAIPVILGHRYISGRIERMLTSMEDLASRVLDALAGPSAAGTGNDA